MCASIPRRNNLPHARIVTVRNAGKSPLQRIPLQISSSLNWERIRIAGRDVSLPVATINSDSDHTGQLHEAVVPLAEPLAPGINDTDRRHLLRHNRPYRSPSSLRGTPEDSAAHSDWDEISPAFTGCAASATSSGTRSPASR